MKGFSKLNLGLLVAAMVIAGPRADAQAFGLSVTPTASSILVSNSLTYTINLTNLTVFTFPDVWVTNTFSAPIQYLTATASQAIPILQTNATTVWFDLGAVSPGVVQADLTVQPNTTGFLTNTVIVTDTTTNMASASAVVQVTNVAVQAADLGVTMTGPRKVVITNDWMTYGVMVTNAGPDAASGVVLTNTLPAGVIAISPATNQAVSTNKIFTFPLGTLPNGVSTNLQFTVQPTQVSNLTFSVSVGSGASDTNTANNFASTNIAVTAYLPGTLAAVTNSPEIYNMQNNLVEQDVLLTNQGTNLVVAARVVVSGLATTNVLFNAVGTNNGNPFVVYDSPLAAGQSGELLLQYAANNYFPFTNSQLHAFAVTPPDLAVPPAMAVSTNINILSITKLSSGRILIWFPSVSNRTYTVVYSSDLSSTNWLMAQPSVVAPTTYTEWIDYGPPATVSAPTNTPVRFYRVYQNP